MSLSDIIAIKIQELMNEKDITIYKLESLSGVYSSTISQFLTRKTKTIRFENLVYILKGLGTNLAEFFSDKRLVEAEELEWKNKLDI